jgi:hypothetical protein
MSLRLRYSLVQYCDSELAGWCACWFAAAAAAAGLLGVLAWWDDGWDHVCLDKRVRGRRGVEWSGEGGTVAVLLSLSCACACVVW